MRSYNIRLLVAALLLAATVFAALPADAACPEPRAYRLYFCTYDDNGDQGFSVFKVQSYGPQLRRGIEDFSVNGVWDNRKVTFARDDNSCNWSYFIDPGLGSCSQVTVGSYGATLTFRQCTGEARPRTCFLF